MSIVAPPLQATPLRPPFLVQHDWRPLFWLCSIIALLALQLASGTEPRFALLVTLFLIVTYATIKELGGVGTFTGFCVFYLVLQNVLVSQIAKAFFWEPADSLLQQPLTTIGVYVCAISGIYFAAVFTRRVCPLRRRPLFLPITDPTRLMWISYVSLALFVLQTVFMRAQSAGADGGGPNLGAVSSLAGALVLLGPLSMASGTAFAIMASRGRRSVGFVNSVTLLLMLLGGILSGSREGITSGAMIYIVTCLAFRFRFRFIHYAVLIGGALIAVYILLPYALLARATVRTPDMAKNIKTTSTLLLEIASDPLNYQRAKKDHYDANAERAYKYYVRQNASLDRFSLIKVTDGIVDATLREGTLGMKTVAPGFTMPIPRVLLPDKGNFQSYDVSNILAHREPGLVNRNDHTTGITTGFTSDAFSSYGWAGAFLIPFLILTAWFWTVRFLVQDSLSMNVFGAALVLILAHGLSESPIAAQISAVIQGPTVLPLFLWAILRLSAFATRTQAKIQFAKQQAVVQDRSQVLGSRRPPARRRHG